MDGRADRLGGEYLRVKFSPLPKDMLSFIAVVARLLTGGFFCVVPALASEAS